MKVQKQRANQTFNSTHKLSKPLYCTCSCPESIVKSRHVSCGLQKPANTESTNMIKT